MRIIPQARKFFARHWNKLLVLVFWVLIVVVYWRITQEVAPTLEAKVLLVADWFVADWWGPLLFVVVYTIQPLVFFPTFIMAIISGMLYGPIYGMMLTVIGLNSAATVTYSAARFLGEDTVDTSTGNRWLRYYLHQLHSSTFETILTLNLLYVPFDMLNYLAGFMRLNWRQFALATALGTLPSGLAYVLFGNSLGSLEQITHGEFEINRPLLGFSIALAIGAYGVTRYIKRRKGVPQTEEAV